MDSNQDFGSILNNHSSDSGSSDGLGSLLNQNKSPVTGRERMRPVDAAEVVTVPDHEPPPAVAVNTLSASTSLNVPEVVEAEDVVSVLPPAA